VYAPSLEAREQAIAMITALIEPPKVPFVVGEDVMVTVKEILSFGAIVGVRLTMLTRLRVDSQRSRCLPCLCCLKCFLPRSSHFACQFENSELTALLHVSEMQVRRLGRWLTLPRDA
jgi:hypothetical protein